MYLRIDLDRALGAAEGHVDNGALVPHQRRERLHLLVDERRVADAAFGRQLVVAVFDAPGARNLDLAARPAHGKLKVVHAVAGASDSADLQDSR